MKHPNRPTTIALITALTILLVAGASWWALSLASLATRAKADAIAGARSLASMDTTGAAAQFGTAKRSFSRAEGMLGPGWLGKAVGTIPLIGHQYSTARELVAIGLEVSTAGAELAGALTQAADGESTGGAASGLESLLSEGGRGIDSGLTALVDVADRAASLEERGLVPPLAKQVRSVKTAIQRAAPFLERGRALLPLERYLLSSDRRILVVSQDGAELRPTGGFAGSFGVIEFGPTGLRLEEYQDVYVLPDPPYEDVFLMPAAPRGFTPPPGARMTSEFGFRDANWWIDFPTSARAMLGFWQDYRQPPVDGIAVVDTVAMGYLLEALGPVYVPSYAETFTHENLLTRLLHYTSVKGGEGRKDVIRALATELERRVLSAGPPDLVKSARALARAADAKHVQAYFTDPQAQAAITALGWSGGLAPPADATDLLVISNTMNLGSKVNMAMSKTIDYQVALLSDGTARTSLVLGYSNTGPYEIPGRDSFGNWLRVSRAPGSAFASDGGGYGILESGLPTEVRTFSVGRGQIHRETLVAYTPAAWRTDRALRSFASSDSGATDFSWLPRGVSRYRLFIVRQADLEDIPTTVTVTPQPGWQVYGVSAQLNASDTPLPTTRHEGRAQLAMPLSGDLILDVWLAPSGER